MIWGTDIDFFSPNLEQEKAREFLICFSSEFKKFARWGSTVFSPTQWQEKNGKTSSAFLAS